MEKQILTKQQKTVLQLVGSEPKLKQFYLSGGTALAGFYLGHRLSDDLDFFSFSEPNSIFLHEFIKIIKAKIKAKKVIFEKLYDRNIFLFTEGPAEELKIEFSKYPFKQLAVTKIKNKVKIDSLQDIATNKLMAMLDRFDPKDFVDLFFLLKKFKLEKIRKDAEKKFGLKIDSIFLGGELMKVNRIAALPKMIKPLTITKLKKYFLNIAKNLKPQIF